MFLRSFSNWIANQHLNSGLLTLVQHSSHTWITGHHLWALHNGPKLCLSQQAAYTTRAISWERGRQDQSKQEVVVMLINLEFFIM